MTNYYSFTPDLTISISAKYKKYLRYFDSEYWFAKIKNAKKVDIELKIVNKIGKKEGAKIVHRYFKFKKLFWFEYLIDFSHKPILILIKQHPIAFFYLKAFAPFIQTNVLEPIIYYLVLNQGYYFLHASTVCKKNQATSYVGRGGAGKTKTALNSCLYNQFEFMGDDLIFLHCQSLRLYYFPRPLHLFSYNFFKIPRPKHLAAVLLYWRLYFIIRFKDFLRFFIKLITKENPLISTRVDVRYLYPEIKIAKEAILNELVFLNKPGNKLTSEVKQASDLRVDCEEILKNLPAKYLEQFRLLEDKNLQQVFQKIGYN